MPGITGIFDPKGSPRNEMLLSQMLNSITRFSWHSNDIYISKDRTIAIGRADLGISNPEKQPIFCPTRDKFIFFYGKIYHYGDIEDADNQGRKGSDPYRILNLYERYGNKLFSALNGDFILSIYDSRTKTAVIANDRYGLRPLYCVPLEGSLIFGSEMKALLKHPSVPRLINIEALSDFLTYRFVLGNKTLVKDLFLLPPASILTYSLETGQWRIDQYWNLLDHLDSGTRGTIKSSLREIDERFQEAVKRRISSNGMTTISLSGGLDSRTILAVLDCYTNSINTITSGVKGSVDEKITQRISKLCNCPHIFYECSSSLLKNALDYCRQVVIMTDGMRGSTYNALTILGGLRCLQNGLKNVIYGHGGEVAKLNAAYNFTIGPDIAESGRTNFLDYIHGRMRLKLWDEIDCKKLFKNKVLASMHEQSFESLKSIVKKTASNLPLEQKVTYLFLNEFFRKFSVLSMTVVKNYTEVHLPFMDNDFLDAVFRAPVALRYNYRIHRYILHQHRPALLDIPLSQTRVCLDATKIERLFVSLPYKILQRLGFFSKDKPEHYIVKNLKTDSFLRILLEPRTLDRNIFDREYLQEILEKWAKGKKSYIHLLSLLVMFEIWQRLFLDGDSMEIERQCY